MMRGHRSLCTGLRMSSGYKRGRLWSRLKRFPGRLLDRLSALGAILIAPIDTIFSAIGKKVFALSDDFTGVELLAGWVINTQSTRARAPNSKCIRPDEPAREYK